MRTPKNPSVLPILACGLAALVSSATFAQENWPPAPRLTSPSGAQDTAPLPSSITAEYLQQDEWRCTFHFRPQASVEKVVLVGSFNNWDRSVHSMRGPNAQGDWTAEVDLSTGVHEYKFLVNGDEWMHDPANPERVPDGFGDFNSVFRLGQLARMEESGSELGDGRIEVLGLAHRPPAALYIQPVDMERVSVRYRTFAHDVQNVWLAIKDGDLLPMSVRVAGPLFYYYELTLPVPGDESGRSSSVRSLAYTFVLDDGAGRVCDPYTYRYSFTPSSLFDAPDWAADAVWYEIMLDRFRNGDPGNDPKPVRPWTSAWFEPSPWEGQDGQTFYQNYVFDRHYGGDLAGLEEEFAYLKELGVNTLYLTPVFEAPSYHKYDVQNYLHVDDQFGGDGDYQDITRQEDLLDPSTWQWTTADKRFLEFVGRAHEAGLRVVIDAVFNHVGASHPAFRDVQENGKRSRFADWFDVTSWEPFAYKGWTGFAHMPVFKKNPYGFVSSTLKRHLFSVTQRWMDPNGDGDPSDGVDGWRLDVPNDIPRPFWVEWRRHVKSINPDALITGEVWNRADQWLDGRHFDAVMNYEFARTAVAWLFNEEKKIPVSEAAARLAELRLAYPSAANYVLQNLVDSHDTDRLASMAQNPDRIYDRQNRVQDNNADYDNSKPMPESYRRARLMALLQMTYVGTPLIYYGDEVGMWGADDPSNRKPMLWKDLEPYAKPEVNHVMDDHLAYYRQIAALRNEHAVLRRGDFESLLTDDTADVWAFRRGDGEAQIVVVLNASNTDRVVHVPAPAQGGKTWRVLLGEGEQVQVSGEKLTVAVPGLSGVVLGSMSQ